MDNNENKKEHKALSKVIFIALIVGAALLVLAALTAIVMLLFPVKEIEVEGDSRYAYSEIIEISGVEEGNRLFYLNKEKAENKILQAFPYLESVEVESYFPNKIKITIKEYEDVYLVPHEQGFCYVNGQFEILEIVESAPTYDEFSGIYIKLENTVSGEVGDVYVNDDSKRASELIAYIKQYGFYQYLNIVDVDDKYDNGFIVGKRYKFVLGSMADVEEKIDNILKVVFSDTFNREESCLIDATNKKNVVYRPLNQENILKEFDFCKK